MSSVMRSLYVSANESIEAGTHVLKENHINSVPVITGSTVLGTLKANQLKRADSSAVHSVGQLVSDSAPFEFVHSDQPLSLALERMGLAGVDALPVVSRADGRTYVGTITLADALSAYGITREGVAKE
jgi:predicted transcriptional regulator